MRARRVRGYVDCDCKNCKRAGCLMLCGHVMRAETESGNQSKKRQVLVMCMSMCVCCDWVRRKDERWKTREL